jgi:hypothetical protein
VIRYRPVTGSYRITTSPARAGTGEPLHRLEPVPVRGFTGPVHRLVGSANDNHAEDTEQRVLDSITQPNEHTFSWTWVLKWGCRRHRRFTRYWSRIQWRCQWRCRWETHTRTWPEGSSSQERGIHFKLFRVYSRQRTERGASKVLHHAWEYRQSLWNDRGDSSKLYKSLLESSAETVFLWVEVIFT